MWKIPYTRLKNRIYTIMIIPLMFHLSSCLSGEWPGPADIFINWEVVSNTYNEEETMVKAMFTMENAGNTTLGSDGWELYFNQSPRYLLDFDARPGLHLERISGDWYRITPLEGFELKPGETTSFTYESRNWWIKESDAPKGFYFVFHHNDGRQHFMEVENIIIKPFERPEQLSRHFRDQMPVPDPGWQFHENKKMTLLNGDKLPWFIPQAVSVKAGDTDVLFSEKFVIHYEEGLGFEARYLQSMLNDLLGWEIDIQPGFSGERFGIDLLFDDRSVGRNPESYTLQIRENGNIAICGSDNSGVFYGIQSLVSLLPFNTEQTAELVLTALKAEDAPRFGYRGVHVDVSRNFFPKESIFKLLDILAFYKINTLHMHLTDDEGWRIEIQSLPELTATGGQRGHTTKDANALHPAFGSGPFHHATGKTGGGFYTQQDFIDILQYARDRHIRVIPEINLPGHARAAIKAMEARYEYYMEQGDAESAEEYRLIDPEEQSKYLSAQLFTDNVVNVARESVYRFFETVTGEVIDMYAKAGAVLEIIHVGGDEVPAGAWTKSPMIDDKMNELAYISKPQNMHAYFTERALEILSAHGINMAGWEEVALKADASGHHVPNPDFANGPVIPYVWNNLWGMQDLGYRLANRGFPVILCHVTAFYFDLAYNKDPEEPGLYWGGFVNTRSAWHYNPYNVFWTTLKDNMGREIDTDLEYQDMERLNVSARENILGLQAQLWSETILSTDMLEYYLLPKLIGFAESAWAKERVWETTPDPELRQKQVEEMWNIFANKLAQHELPRLSHIFGGYNYRIPPPGAVIKDDMLKANTEFPGLIIRYTTDGSTPDANSPIYQEAVSAGNQSVKLKAFDASGRSSRTVRLGRH